MHYTCQALARRKIGVRVVTTNANGPHGARLNVPTDSDVCFEKDYAVRYYAISRFGYLSWPLFVQLGRDIDGSDLVHLQDVYSFHAVQALLLSAKRKRSILISPRGIFSAWALGQGRQLGKRIWINCIIRPLLAVHRRVAWHATSCDERNDILSIFPGSSVYIVPNAIDIASVSVGRVVSRRAYLQRFFPDCSVDPDAARVLLSMGRLHPVKGFDIAIRALSELRQRSPESVLLIAGNDEGEGRKLEMLIGALGLEGRARLVGPLYDEDKASFLVGGDIFLLPSHSENFGLAVLEGLAAGMPVVVSSTTPWEEVHKRHSGLWVRNSPEAFSEAICDLYNRDLEALRKNARLHAEAYSLGAISEMFESIYSGMINETES